MHLDLISVQGEIKRLSFILQGVMDTVSPAPFDERAGVFFPMFIF